jgi:hypothetical protein
MQTNLSRAPLSFRHAIKTLSQNSNTREISRARRESEDLSPNPTSWPGIVRSQLALCCRKTPVQTPLIIAAGPNHAGRKVRAYLSPPARAFTARCASGGSLSEWPTSGARVVGARVSCGAAQPLSTVPLQQAEGTREMSAEEAAAVCALSTLTPVAASFRRATSWM